MEARGDGRRSGVLRAGGRDRGFPRGRRSRWLPSGIVTRTCSAPDCLSLKADLLGTCTDRLDVGQRVEPSIGCSDPGEVGPAMRTCRRPGRSAPGRKRGLIPAVAARARVATRAIRTIQVAERKRIHRGAMACLLLSRGGGAPHPCPRNAGAEGLAAGSGRGDAEGSASTNRPPRPGGRPPRPSGVVQDPGWRSTWAVIAGEGVQRSRTRASPRCGFRADRPFPGGLGGCQRRPGPVRRRAGDDEHGVGAGASRPAAGSSPLRPRLDRRPTASTSPTACTGTAATTSPPRSTSSSSARRRRARSRRPTPRWPTPGSAWGTRGCSSTSTRRPARRSKGSSRLAPTTRTRRWLATGSARRRTSWATSPKPNGASKPTPATGRRPPLPPGRLDLPGRHRHPVERPAQRPEVVRERLERRPERSRSRAGPGSGWAGSWPLRGNRPRRWPCSAS